MGSNAGRGNYKARSRLIAFEILNNLIFDSLVSVYAPSGVLDLSSSSIGQQGAELEMSQIKNESKMEAGLMGQIEDFTGKIYNEISPNF